MSTPSRRSRRLATAATIAAAPSLATPPPSRLLDLPTDLLVRVVSRFYSPIDIARVAAVSLLFHASLAEEGIRLWAQERGFELLAQPEGEGCAVRWVCFAALLRQANPPARVAAGWEHSVFIDGEGQLWSCGEALLCSQFGGGAGRDIYEQPTPLISTLDGTGAVSAAAAIAFHLALTAAGSVWSWGDGQEGRLGHGDETERGQPEKIEALAGQRVVAVSAGDVHCLALSADGAVWSWGYGEQGRLGHGDQQNQLLPKKVEALAGQRAVAVSAGAEHSIALTADGAVWSWGGGEGGQVGHGDRQRQLLPKKVEALAGQRVVAVSAGDFHSLALTADGAVFTWGCDPSTYDLDNTEEGDAIDTDLVSPEQIRVLAGRGVVAVSAGGNHSLAITADTSVIIWEQRALGVGEEWEADDVPFCGDAAVVAVSAGTAHSLAVTADGAVWSWGRGGDALGHGGDDYSDRWCPEKIEAWPSRPPSLPAVL